MFFCCVLVGYFCCGASMSVSSDLFDLLVTGGIEHGEDEDGD
jgi:hypothetical protein